MLQPIMQAPSNVLTSLHYCCLTACSCGCKYPPSCHLCRHFTCMACYASRAQQQNPDVCCHVSRQVQSSAQQEGPNISRLDPALQQQWDHAANAHLGPIEITPYSNRKVWWTCDQCPDGHLHSWEATPNNRTRGRGCPQCSGRKVCKHNSLATKAPKVAAQWDFEKNAGTPDRVVAQSNKPVGWLCEVCGNTWSAAPDARVSKHKQGCPQCYDNTRGKNQIKHPTFAEAQEPRGKALLAEWDHERNALQRHFPHTTRLHSRKQIFWLCHKCPAGQQHSWSATPNSRNNRSKPGCPFCAGKAACKCNSLQTLYPAILAEWDHSRNDLQPSDYTGSSTSEVWWTNPLRGSWKQSIDQRTREVRWKHKWSQQRKRMLSES